MTASIIHEPQLMTMAGLSIMYSYCFINHVDNNRTEYTVHEPHW